MSLNELNAQCDECLVTIIFLEKGKRNGKVAIFFLNIKNDVVWDNTPMLAN